jgi:glycosyltransferase involved in cell wall biosynthesis
MALNVLMTYTSYPRDPKDWRGIFIYKLACALAQQEDLHLSLWGPPGHIPPHSDYVATSQEMHWLEHLAAQGGIAHRLRNHPVTGKLSAIRLLGFLRSVYKRTRPVDLYHVNWLQNALPLKTQGKPLVVSVLGTDMKYLSNPLVRWSLRKLFKSTRTTLTPNGSWMVPVLEKHFGDIASVQYLPFGVDEDWFDIKRKPEAEQKKIWLTVLRLTSKKIGELFNWGHEFFQGEQELHLFGPKQEAIDVPDWVHYHGSAHPEELLYDWFPRAQGMVTLSQHDEGQPQVILEAMAAGLPVVASNIQAHRNLLDSNETGVLVDTKQEFLEAMTGLSSSDYNKKIGDQARHWLKENIGTWNDCAQRYRNVYQSLIGQN